jgi:hypothetical protein
MRKVIERIFDSLLQEIDSFEKGAWILISILSEQHSFYFRVRWQLFNLLTSVTSAHFTR